MEYRGKTFTIVQGIGPDSWKWAVYSDDKIVKSGEAKTRASAQTRAIWVIDQVLAKVKLYPPPRDDDVSFKKPQCRRPSVGSTSGQIIMEFLSPLTDSASGGMAINSTMEKSVSQGLTPRHG